MKKLYQFTLKETVIEQVEEESKDKDGNDITIKKDIENNIERHIFLKKPTRSMFDEAELYYGVQLSEGIKAGLLTRALLAKRFSNDGGAMSEGDKEEYANLYLKLFENQNEIQRLSMVSDKKKSKEEKAQAEELLKENGQIKREIQEFEMAQASLFDQTAENRARNKAILWWVLNMSHFEEPQSKEATQIFSGDSYEEKLASYDRMEEDGSEFEEEVLKKLIYYVSYWYVGQAQTQEEFEEVLKALEETGVEEEAQQAIEDAFDPQEEKPKAKKSKKKATKKEKEEIIAEVVEEVVKTEEEPTNA